MRRVLFGGTFDPVHDGHVAIFRLLSSEYDSVVVMPAAVSPFKTSPAASAKDRIALLRLAVEGLDRVAIDGYETEKGGVSYTAETLRAYPDCDLAVGGDSMNTLARWTNADEIRKNTRIVVIERSGSASCAEAIRDWNEAGGRAETIGTVPNASSFEARLRLSLERHCDFLPPAVEAYCLDRGLYREWDFVGALYVRFGVKETRIEHSRRVAYTALELAERYGADRTTTVRAALLHDLAKYVSPSEARSLGVRLSEAAETAIDSVRHAYVGADIADQILGETPEIVDAIRWHTTGKPAMSLVTKIVCLADYIEPGRAFPGVDEIRTLAETNLDAAVVAMFGRTVRYLERTDRAVDPMTAAAYDYYRNETRGIRAKE